MVQLYVCIYKTVKHATPLIRCGSFLPSGHNLNKPGSGELHDTKAPGLIVSEKKVFNYFILRPQRRCLLPPRAII